LQQSLVIVGAGMAATRLVDELTRDGGGDFAITLIGAEPRAAYNRVLLSSYLASEITADDLTLKPSSWWIERGVEKIIGDPVLEIDRTNKSVRLSSGKIIAFDKLVLATGSSAIRLPKPGMNLPGVVTFRDFDDASRMLSAAGPDLKAAVIGGGLLGLEAAYGLAKAGARVTLIHLMDRLMERQLDAAAAALLADAMRAQGVDIILQADTARVLGEDRATGLELADGRVIPADLVVCAVGIRPEISLARAAGIAVNRGIVVDDGLATSDADVYAIGECAEHRGAVYGLVEPAYEQARVLASKLRDAAVADYPGSTIATNLKISGVGVFSAGDFIGADGTDAIIYSDTPRGVYKKFVIANETLVGAVLFGETIDATWYLDLIRGAENIADIRDDLAFGRGAAMRLAA
jgi:nitrite reductase (NADH) large subunit